MKGWGLALICLGALIALGSLLMTVTTPTDVPASLGSLSYSVPSNVLNLGLLQNQMMVFISGLAVALAGVVMTVGGSIDSRGNVGLSKLGLPGAPAERAAPVIESQSAFAAYGGMTEDQRAQRRRVDHILAWLLAAVVLIVGVLVLWAATQHLA